MKLPNYRGNRRIVQIALIGLLGVAVISGSVALFYQHPQTASASSVGPRTATSSADCVDDNTGSVGSITWTSPGNAAATDGTSATAGVPKNGGKTHYIKCTNFGFTSAMVPTGATINGIVVGIKRMASTASAIQDKAVRIVQGGTIGSVDHSTATFWPTSLTNEDHGSSTDLWGLSWAPSDITASTFGATVAATQAGNGGTVTASVDVMTITVYFTVPATLTQSNYRLFAEHSGVANITANTIATSTDNSATGTSSQRKTFWDSTNSRYWAFYNNGSAIAYANSSDGASWVSMGTTGVATHNFSVYAVGGTSTIYLVYMDTANTVIKAEKGQLSTSGITWTGLTTVLAASTSTPALSIARSGNGIIWVVFGSIPTGPCCPPRTVLAVHSVSADDTSAWSSSITVYSMSSGTFGSVSVVPLSTVGNVYLVFDTGATGNTYGALWDDSTGTMGSVVTIASSQQVVSVCAGPSDTVDLSTSANFYHYSSGSWGSGIAMAGAGGVLSRDSSGNLWAVSGSGSSLQVQKGVTPYGSGNWGSLRSVYSSLNASVTNVTAAVADDGSGHILVAWLEGSSSPYNVRFMGISTDPATDVGSPLAAQNTAATLASPGQSFRLRQLINVSTSNLAVSGQSFMLQYAQRGADNLCDTGFSGEVYSDVFTPGSVTNATTNGANDSSIGTVDWSSPSNITASDLTYSSSTIPISGSSHYLVATGFGFAVPSNAQIVGISAKVVELGDNSMGVYVYDNAIRIVKGGVIGSTDRSLPSGSWPSARGTVTYGGSTDLWGVTWTANDINSSNFGVAISAKNTDTTSAHNASVDYVQIQVNYLSPGIAGYNNTTAIDGAPLFANANDPIDGANTIVSQTYTKSGATFTNSVAAVNSGQDGEWDFDLYDNGAPAGTTYCFRVVKSDGSLLDSYSQIPQITTATAATPTPSNDQLMRHGSWFNNGIKMPFTF